MTESKGPTPGWRPYTLSLVLVAGVLAFALPGRAQAQVVITAVAFFGNCSSPIAVTQNTRVSGAATVAGSCEVVLDPGVTLEFSNAVVAVDALSITDTNATVRVTNSRLEALTGALVIDLGGTTSSARIVNSVLRAGEDLVVAAAAVNVSGAQLTGAESVEIAAPVGAATITSSRLEAVSRHVLVTAHTNATVTSSALTAGFCITVAAVEGAATIINSRLQASFCDVQVVGTTSVAVAGSALTAAEFLVISASDGPVTITSSRLQSMNNELAVFGGTNVGVTSSTLRAPGDLEIVAFTGAAMITSSQLESTADSIFVGGSTKAAVASSLFSAALNTEVSAVGPTSVQTSRFAGDTVDIISLSTTSAVLNNFTGVTGGVSISGVAGCTSSRNVPETPCI